MNVKGICVWRVGAATDGSAAGPVEAGRTVPRAVPMEAPTNGFGAVPGSEVEVPEAAPKPRPHPWS